LARIPSIAHKPSQLGSRIWRAANARALLCAGFGGLLFASSAPPTNFFAGVVLGLSALYLAFADATSIGSAALRAWLWASAAGVLGMAFIASVVDRFTSLGLAGGAAALLLLSAFQGLTWALGAALAQIARLRFGLWRPISFGVLTFIAISLPSVIGWTPAALLSPWPALVQSADCIGERGVSFVIAIAAALLAAPFLPLIRRARDEPSKSALRKALAGALILVALWAQGKARLHGLRQDLARRPHVELGLVQAAVPAELRWRPAAKAAILQHLRELTLRSERAGAELTLWPEAAYPYVLPHGLRIAPADARRIVGQGVRGPILFGLITRGEAGAVRYNSANVVAPDGSLQKPQAKLALLWFGETVPFSEYLPFLRRIFARSGSLTEGTEVALLEYRTARLGILNCYEDTLPGIGRRIARANPNLLVNLTNDAWFGPTAEPELHLRLSVMRAIETRLDLVRAVNLGVPAWIDATGTIRARGDETRESVLRVSAGLNDMTPTLYTKAGDIPVWLGIVLAMLAAAFRSRTQKPNRKTSSSDETKRIASSSSPEHSATERDPSAP
jgi:apolipoprotein N-acyltransferase